mmetsp:Transcript_18258/g.1601  ORF Transcript_18258/g.1601 Transcript_18258/m.1601 type:complete len:108 (-) Transcript_18258:297-620(-)
MFLHHFHLSFIYQILLFLLQSKVVFSCFYHEQVINYFFQHLYSYTIPSFLPYLSKVFLSQIIIFNHLLLHMNLTFCLISYSIAYQIPFIFDLWYSYINLLLFYLTLF